MLNTFVHKSAIVIFGSAISEEMGDEIRVTLVATGLDRPLDANEPGSGVQAPAVFNASSEAPAGLQTPVFGQTLEAGTYVQFKGDAYDFVFRLTGRSAGGCRG